MMKAPARPRSIPAAKAVKRPRGRPPRPGGPTPQADIQRAYRARLKAAGKVVRLVDPAAIIPDFNADTHFVCERTVFEQLRYDFNTALLKIVRLTEDLEQLQLRNRYLEADLKQLERHHTIALKDIIVLKQQAAQSVSARPRLKPRRKG
jgi:hypothetical protein